MLHISINIQKNKGKKNKLEKSRRKNIDSYLY